MTISENDPQEGLYWYCKVRGGPKVPVRIWLEDGERDEEFGVYTPVWKAMAGDVEVDVLDVWVWVCMHPIHEEEYNRLLEQGRKAAAEDPHSANARPNEAVNWKTEKPTF